MDVSLRLLGKVNAGTTATSTIRERYVATITADALNLLLAFERAGARKSDRYKIRKDSFIQVDDQIQRGKDTQGNLLQLPAKVFDIANTLLGVAKNTAPMAFLGTLIWNVRPGPTTSLQIVQEQVIGEPGPPRFTLKVRTDHVWLTDSAHRHLGIAQAFRLFQAKPDGYYPRFKPDCEFVVEIYSLDKAEEKALFYELNALQKRITSAKRKELDTVTSAGFVKDAIREYDESAQRLFVENVEVTSVQNINHTLMTMSLFVSSIHEMFAKAELDEAKTDPQKRVELAEFYCEFFYKLHSTINVDITDPEQPNNKVRTIKPFYNLYSEIIQPVLDVGESSDTLENGGGGAFEANLEAARLKAKAFNGLVRSQDIANSNTNIKALCRIARLIRPMPKWEAAIDYLQTKLNVPAQNRFFQATNKDLVAPPALPSGVQIVKLNDDGTLNIQVVSQTLGSLVRYLRRKLELELPPTLRLVPEDPEGQMSDLPLAGTGAPAPSRVVNRDAGGTIAFEAVVFVAGIEAPEDGAIRLALGPVDDTIDWKDMTLTGARRATVHNLTKDEGYEHPIYGKDIARYVAALEITTGKAPTKCPNDVEVVATLYCPDLDPSSRVDEEFRFRIVLT